MTKPTLILQPGKTYVTNSGDEVTMELNYNQNGSYPFIGDNKCTYTENGCIFAWGESNDLDISHELIQDTIDETPEVHLIDVLKFKQKSNGTKRKLILKDYSDDSVEIIFKTKFSKDKPQVTTGIRLSYEAILLLYDSLEYMLEENQRTLH